MDTGLPSKVEREITSLIRRYGRITFAQFMYACLYSPDGGFYRAPDSGIRANFRTSPTSSPVFGALIARQLEQMWRLLEEPSVFHVIEIGSGDGSLAASICEASQRVCSRFAQATYYVVADYEPGLPRPNIAPNGRSENPHDKFAPGNQSISPRIERVRTQGIGTFRNIVGCIISNELLDNFPVHRFAICGSKVWEAFVTLAGDRFTEVLNHPSSPRIEERLVGLNLSLPDGYRGEVNLGMEDWTREVSEALDRGFVLTIDYGGLASELYSSQNAGGTLVCFRSHSISGDPYLHIGQQDITCQVDFTTLMRAGMQHGLSTVGYARQNQFLENLGFASFLDANQTQGLSAARTELNRIAMMTLVDPNEYGNLRVLAQAKGLGSGIKLSGFADSESVKSG